MMTEIAGLTISYKNADDLKMKAGTVLEDVRGRLNDVEKDRKQLRRREKLLQRFLGFNHRVKPIVINASE